MRMLLNVSANSWTMFVARAPEEKRGATVDLSTLYFRLSSKQSGHCCFWQQFRCLGKRPLTHLRATKNSAYYGVYATFARTHPCRCGAPTFQCRCGATSPAKSRKFIVAFSKSVEVSNRTPNENATHRPFAPSIKRYGPAPEHLSSTLYSGGDQVKMSFRGAPRGRGGGGFGGGRGGGEQAFRS